MRVVVAFPWRPSVERLPSFEIVRAWYGVQLPDAQVVEVDTAHEVFNLAACRNAAVRAGIELEADVVVISDADTIVSPDALRAAVDEAGDGRLHLPFDQCLYAGTDAEPGLANGGVHVVTPECWDAIGGQDERLSGWGGDDDQLVAVATCLVGVVRHHGFAVSLWHADAHRVASVQNKRLAQKYWDLVDDPVAMRSYIAKKR